MPSEKSLHLAAQAWLTKKTKTKITDADLAIAFAFAEILDKEKEKFKEILDTIILINKQNASGGLNK
jgi:hypothetical protein